MKKEGSVLKKFQFSLETMLVYKQQMLESLQQEYATAQGFVVEQERVIQTIEDEYDTYNEEFRIQKETGMNMIDAMRFEGGLRALEMDLKKQMVVLKKLEAKAEEKRMEMIQAKQETSSAEKLKEKKLESYNQVIQKNEEAMIDELVAAKWSLSR